jgi:hypothetical protein
MRKEQILKFKQFSQSKNSEYSPWNEKNDPELSMWSKTVLKQFAKLLPKNEDIYRAIDKDNDDGDIKQYIDEKISEQKTEVALTKAQELNQKYLADKTVETTVEEVKEVLAEIEDIEILD